MPKPLYPTGADIRAAMLGRADEFCRVTGQTYSDIGAAALNDNSILYKIKHGHNFKIETYERINRWLDGEWPRDTVPIDKPNGGPRKRRK